MYCPNVSLALFNFSLSPLTLVLPLGEVEDLPLILAAVVLGLEVCEHCPIHSGGVGGQVEVDDEAEEPDLEPAPFSNRLQQHVVKALHFFFFCLFNFIFTKNKVERFNKGKFSVIKSLTDLA